jgi:hypothetical protein
LGVVEGDGEVVFWGGLGLGGGGEGGVVFVDLDCFAVGEGLGFGEVRGRGDLKGEGGDGEVLRAGQAAAEGDEAGGFEVFGGLF